MTSTSWNDREDEALDYLPWDAQVLYLRGLRRRMDYATGVVGLRAPISRRWLMQLLEQHQESGSHRAAPALTDSKLRALLRLLERNRLIERVKGYERTLVFFLPLADRDQSVSRRNDRGTTEERPRRSDRAKPNTDTASEDVNDRGTTEERPRRSAPIPVSGIPERNSAAKEPTSEVEQSVGATNELVAALAEMGFRHEQVHTPRAMGMIRRWTEMQVSPGDLRQVVDILRRRNPHRVFGPAYLEQPVTEYLAGQLKPPRPDWAKVPRDNDELWHFAKEHGFPDPGTRTHDQYRSLLYALVERRMHAEGLL